MSRPQKPGASHAGNVFRFTLAGLIIFSLALIAGSAFIAWKLTAVVHPKLAETFAVDPNDKTRSVHTGPWGELETRDIELERPAEFMDAEVSNPLPETWTFKGLKPDAVRSLLAKDGLTDAQVAALMTPAAFSTDAFGTKVTPSAEFFLSLNAESRGKLYPVLAGLGVNYLFDFPYIFPDDTIESIYADSRLHPDDVALLKRLVYLNGDVRQLADFEALMVQIPTVERRLAMSRALSRQAAVIGRLFVKPDTDVDKVVDYWTKVPGVRRTDIRPLLSSLKRLPAGGDISLLYLLPKFARDRLYTFPHPPEPGDPVMDCHWSTFNFSSETPDNRFNDPNFALQYIKGNYYQIAAPAIEGDILLLMNEKDEIKHSATFLADNLIFTKNGNNFHQPWMIMRIPALLAMYPTTPPMRVIYMRRKTD